MTYNLLYKSAVKKDLKKISKSEARKILNKIETALISKPLNPQLKGEFKGLRKLRIGDYRIIYKIESENIIVIKIGHRKEIYR